MEFSSLITHPFFIQDVSWPLCKADQIRYYYSLTFIKLYVLQTQELCLIFLCPSVTAGLIVLIHERTQ